MKVSLILLFLTFSTFIIASPSGGSGCNCWQQTDSTWEVAAFDGSGGSGGPGLAPDYRNDDWSTIKLAIPFDFCFYGDTIDSLYINNNGNISFITPYSTFTANSFPDPTFDMVAPFWADVDTRDSLLSGIVHYKIFQHYMVIQWDTVGYFSAHADKRNTFQLIISDGGSSPLPELKNVGFCYKDMQWTTGDASMGVNGYQGSPATVGVNYGDGINYLQIGLYNDSSFNYDGPYGNNDGVFSLSNQSFAFDVCVNSFNVGPILSGQYICDTIVLCVGDTFSYAGSFLAPESGQTTTVTINSHGMSGVNLTTTPGNLAPLSIEVIAATAGIYVVDVIGTDDGAPAANTSYPLIFNIQNCTTGIPSYDEIRGNVSPNPFSNELIYHFENLESLYITDALGKLVYESHDGKHTTVNTSSWQSGVYLLRVKTAQGSNTLKLIK